MPDFVIHGVEHVYDAFDEYEHPNPINVRVAETSLATALDRAPRLLQEVVDKKRVGFRSSGMFVAQLIRVEDDAGHLLFQDLTAINGLLRSYGGDLEDYRDVGSRAVFVSYAHLDEDFATRLWDALSTRGVRLWLDSRDRDTEVALLRFGPWDSDDRTKKVLGRAIGRAHGLLLLLSENSVGRPWVRWEVDFAARAGRDRHLFLACLAIESGVLTEPPDWVRGVIDSGNVHDFRDWRDPSAFESAVRRLMYEVFLFREA